MNAFFKTFFASLLAFVVGGILFVALGVMVLVGIGLSAVSSSFDVSSISIIPFKSVSPLWNG